MRSNFHQPIPRSARIFLIVVTLIALFAPMNYVLMTPGKPAPLFPKTLTIASSSVKTYPVDGQMYLLTVYVTNPETKVLGIEVIGCWIWGECNVLPRSVIYRENTTNKKEIEVGLREMKASQDSAIGVAKAMVNKYFPTEATNNLNDQTIKVSLKNTGGPSGGLIFTLGLIDLLTQENLLHGLSISGTGTIDAQGRVGAIGGVTEKIAGAKKVKSDVIFISRENCYQLPSDVEGISVIAVDSIDQALAYLLAKSQGNLKRERDLNSAGIHGCANLGA